MKIRGVRNAKLNATILVDQAGRTLYHLTKEKRKKIVCTGQCAQLWPPLLVRRGSKPTAGAGVDRKKLGTIRRPDGTVQVTYASFALYRFAGDRKPGQVAGEGVEKIWYAIDPSGRLVKGRQASGYGYGG